VLVVVAGESIMRAGQGFRPTSSPRSRIFLWPQRRQDRPPRSIPINNTRCQSSKNNLPSCGSISSKRDKMKGVNFATALARPSQWTCRKCLVQARGVREAIRQPKQYSTGTNQIPRPKNRGRLVLAATGATLGVGAFVYQDEARHAYYGIQRSGRVLGTLAVCINE
jgi:hypothetical protein